MNKLALGTVQFGLDYGISNSRGKIPLHEVEEILQLAEKSNIDTLDTAAAYGDSEAVLGQFSERLHNFKIVSKLPATSSISVQDELQNSLSRLHCSKLYAWMLHSIETWRKTPKILEEMRECKAAGLVDKIGVSLYMPQDVHELLEQKVPLDIVQVPYSLFDRRFESVFKTLQEYGTEIHVRSVFLQGLFFMNTENLPSGLQAARNSLRILQNAAKENGLSVADLALAFAAKNTAISQVVIGVDGVNSMLSNLESWKRTNKASEILNTIPDLRTEDTAIILPVNWKKS